MAQSKTKFADDFVDIPELALAGAPLTKNNNPERPVGAFLSVPLVDYMPHLRLSVTSHAAHTVWATGTLFAANVLRLTDDDIEHLIEW